MKKLRQNVSRLILAAVSSALFFVPVAAYAQPDLEGSLCGGAGTVQIGEPGDCADSEGEDRINSLITTVVNIFSAVVGIIAVIMIIYNGFRYITSGGDQGKVQSAQQGIIYAIVGLIIVALAQIIVRFVLFRATDGGGGGGGGVDL